jgi:SAM-dependent methyltransferase
MQSSFWNSHYKDFRVQDPSDFAQFCAARYLHGDDRLVELGCGNGRDGALLARNVTSYTGIDACPIAIESFSKGIAGESAAAGNISLKCGDFTALEFDPLFDGKGRLAIYSRFTLHSISYVEADRLFANLEKIAAPRWIFMLEARTIYDELYGVGKSVGPHEFQTDHYRRFIDPAEFLNQLGARFAVKYFEVSSGFARFADQDPVLLRAVFCRKGTSLNSI